MVDSYAWWTVIHQKPEYKNESIDLVGVIADKIIALLTIEINADIIDLIEDEALKARLCIGYEYIP